MEQKNTPIETARQTLMQLMQRKLSPTPDNYRSVYDEIMGIKSIDESVELAKTLEKVLLEAGKQKPKYVVAAQAIAPLIEKGDWSKLEDQLRKLFPLGSGNADVGEANWSVLIRSLLKQLEMSHKGVTLSRKKEGLSKVLTNFAKDPDVLAQKIQALINSWGTGSATETAGTSSLPADGGGATQVTANALTSVQWREMLLRTFELVLIPHLQAVSEHQQKAISLLTMMRQANGEQALAKCANDLKPILLALEMERDHQARIHEALTQLLRLLVASMGSLVIEDQWLYAQTIVINDIISKPLNINTLYDAESSLKELTYKQSQLKPALTEAKDTLKKMVTTFVDRLVEMTESTSDYHDKIEGYQQKIASTEDMGELNVLLNSILEDTRAIGLSVQRTRDEFTLSQKHAMDAEKRIQELTAELDYIGEVAHQDYLTGALNRRGMDEAIEREFNRADRHNTALCVAMLDIDHFKKLNDTLGHATGDQALTHLVKVLKDVLRPTDVLARYGGEEFIIILPATPQDEAIKAVTRVQRELTKNFFMHKNERVLITFSAGVAERATGESAEHLIPRADVALYIAKNSGRNQVIGAELLPEPDGTAVES
ncbi:MAG: GGDEF domain-containing protein [Methylotenera sp.]|nr:GGDEF domain-containing protein [Methylotenera sp.]MDO9232216.1 GGDEF domain-containing protein [Methylotenera sp.]MDO9389529.1 GGDEF domain-containing protein [Methylotenera sp.]MDP2102542.1 GGDEF domain-containing protein [Methylotenera sp.]MDP2280266.1 GGDEF domain-containing protein [Methylotenera sp.]